MTGAPHATPIASRTLARVRRSWVGASTNPVWQREMLQASRMTRTPLILMTLSILLTVITCAVGGIASSSVEPAQLGSILYHVFFSLCFVVVCWVGPGTGTLLVTTEHTNRTWDVLLLTGMAPRAIARGKFAAALTYVGMYLVMLAPIGAIPYITGGVTASEVLLAFVLLGALTLLAVGFGTCVGAAMRRAAPAMLVSIVVAMGVSVATFLALGVGGAAAASEAWPGIVPGAPVWLPSAYLRAEFGWQYVGTLLFAPCATVLLLAWLFQELTVASMTPLGEDRLLGFKRWTLVSYPTVCALAMVVRLWLAERDQFWVAYAGAMSAVFVLSGCALLLACSDDLGPSRRVRMTLPSASRLARWLRPGIARSAGLILLLHVTYTLLLLAFGYLEERENARVLSMPLRGRVHGLLGIAAASIGFVVFSAGLVVLTRARAAGAAAPRLLLVTASFLGVVGPWMLLAISGLSTGDFDRLAWLAAPSPLFSVMVVERLMAGAEGALSLWWMQLGVAAGWIVLGAGAFIRGRSLSARLTRRANGDEAPAHTEGSRLDGALPAVAETLHTSELERR